MRPSIIAPTLLLLAAGAAQAVEFGGIEFHGFYSQGYTISDKNEWLVDRSQHGSFDLNDAAVNASFDATDRLRFAAQIYGSDLYGDPQMVNSGSFDQKKAAKVNLDYAYGQYTFADAIGLRLGRVKQAYGLYNEVRDIDAARSTAILPQSVYDNRDRELNYLVNGIAGFGTFDLAKAGKLEWAGYYGAVNIPVDGTIAKQYVNSDVSLDEVSVDAVYGGQLMWSLPVEGLRMGFSYRNADNLASDAVINAGAFNPFQPAVPMAVVFDEYKYYLGSIEYTSGDLTLQAEYQRVLTHSTYTAGNVPPFSAIIQSFLTPTDMDSQGWYALASYRLHPRVEAGAVVAIYSTKYDEGKTDDWNSYQNDFGVFAGCNLTDWWTLKAEYHYVEGAALLDAQNRETGYFPGSQTVSTEYWSYFVARTTVSF